MAAIFQNFKNETASQEKQFLSIYLEVGLSGKSPKIGLEFRNISGLEKIRYSYKKVCNA